MLVCGRLQVRLGAVRGHATCGVWKCKGVVVWMDSVRDFTLGDVVRKEQINKYGSMKVVL
jgi:hypothetical protein